MPLRRDQEEILKLHGVGRCPRTQLHALALAEEESSGITKLHLRKVDTDAGPGAHAEGVEGCLRIGRQGFCCAAFFGRNPAVGVEP